MSSISNFHVKWHLNWSSPSLILSSAVVLLWKQNQIFFVRWGTANGKMPDKTLYLQPWKGHTCCDFLRVSLSLTLEQYQFELGVSTYVWIGFNKYSWPFLTGFGSRDSINLGWKIVFSHSPHWMENTIVSICGLLHRRIQKANCTVQSYSGFWTVWGWGMWGRVGIPTLHVFQWSVLFLRSAWSGMQFAWLPKLAPALSIQVTSLCVRVTFVK